MNATPTVRIPRTFADVIRRVIEILHQDFVEFTDRRVTRYLDQGHEPIGRAVLDGFQIHPTHGSRFRALLQVQVD